MQEQKLIRLLRKDPERGMSALVDEYGGLVYAVVRGRLRSNRFCEADIEACAADTFSEFYMDLDKFDPSRGGVRGWLCALARNNALDMLRRSYREEGNIPIDEGAAVSIPDDFSLEADFEEKQTRAELLAAIEALGEPDREILVRKYYIAQPSAEIAKKLGMSVSNVDTRAHRAVAKLRKKIGGKEQ